MKKFLITFTLIILSYFGTMGLKIFPCTISNFSEPIHGQSALLSTHEALCSWSYAIGMRTDFHTSAYLLWALLVLFLPALIVFLYSEWSKK